MPADKHLSAPLWGSERDSRPELRAVQQALVYAGYPHGEVWDALTGYLHHICARLRPSGGTRSAQASSPARS